MADYTLVERMLPGRVLTELGIYLQSAAHLELAIWQIIMYADGEFAPTQSKLFDYLDVKKTTPKLISGLKKSIRQVTPNIGVRIALLAPKIEAGLLNRNMAAHGAFFTDTDSSTLHVAHYYSEGKKPNQQWFEANEKISRRDISTAIEEIDLLLREAVSIRDLIEIAHKEVRRTVGRYDPNGFA